MTEKSWAESMYGSDASPAPAPAAKPAATPAAPEGSSWAAVMHKPEAPATAPGDWSVTMHRVEKQDDEPGPWSGAAPQEAPAAAADAAPVVPEVYTFDLPEGLEIAPEMNTELQSALKEAKLGPDQAKKLVDLHVKSVQAQQAQFEKTLESWSSETMATLGASAPEVFAHARTGLERFDQSGKIRELLDRSGLGNRIEFVRLFEQIGRNLEYQKAYQREAARRRP